MKGLLWFFCPFCAFGILAMFFPGMYALFPMQESETCICAFYEMQTQDGRNFLFELNDHAYVNITSVNSFCFYIINWFGLLILIWLVYRIRHTGDDTYLKLECGCIVSVWVFFSVLQYATFIYNYTIFCHNQQGMISEETLLSRYHISYKLAYWIIIVRDFVCLCVMILFQYKASNSQLYFSRLLDLNDKDSTKMALADFEMLLLSVVPHKAFSKFLNQEHPELIPYLQMVHLCKLYQNDHEELELMRTQQHDESIDLGVDVSFS